MNSPGDIECFREQREQLGQKGPELGRLSTRTEALRPVTEVQDLVKERKKGKNRKEETNEGRERKRETKSETQGGRLRERKGSKEGRKRGKRGKLSNVIKRM